MKARDIFGIFLRCAGLWVTIWGAWESIAAFAQLPATIQAVFMNKELGLNSLLYLVYGLPAFIGGILVLRFANAIVWFTYRD